jgi:hypothetical protein
MNSWIQLKTTPSLLVTLTLLCFGLLPRAQAVLPPPDGGYPHFNTAEGQNALFSLTTGQWNTALGAFTLWRNTDGSYNTAVGTAALLLNVGNQNVGQGVQNTAVGAAALLSNTTGSNNTAVGTAALENNDSTGNGFASFNTAVGSGALSFNINGGSNTAVGYNALTSNDSTGNGFANFNTAVGFQALSSNTDGSDNTAVGWHALTSNHSSFNTAIGTAALQNNDLGFGNAAVGDNALYDNTSGARNTAVGSGALFSNTGGDNTAVGNSAGINITGIGIIDIGSGAYGVSGESGVIRIGSDFSGHNACYINGILPNAMPYSTAVDTVSIDLATGQLYHYHDSAPIAAAEQSRKIQEQEATIAELKSEMKILITRIEEQDAKIQKVSAPLEASKPAPQVVNNP